MTARWWPCATTSGRSSSPSSAPTALMSGRRTSRLCASPGSSTSAPTPSRKPSRAELGNLEVAVGPRLPAGPGAAIHRQAPRHVPGISTEPESRQLQPRSGDGETEQRSGRQVNRLFTGFAQSRCVYCGLIPR